MAERVYTLRKTFTNPGAITLLQVKAAAARPIQIIRASVSTGAVSTSTFVPVQLCRKSAAATVTAAVSGDFVQQDPTDSATTVQLSTTATGYTATAEGTDSDIFSLDAWNMVSPWVYVPVFDEREVIAAGGIVALKFTSAPAAGTYYALLRWAESG